MEEELIERVYYLYKKLKDESREDDAKTVLDLVQKICLIDKMLRVTEQYTALLEEIAIIA